MYMATTTAVRGAHLVGSINLPDAETALRSAAEILGGRLKRIPDGEPGERYHWILFQPGRLAATPGLERVGEQPVLVGELDVRPIRIAPGVDAAQLELAPLGYAQAAITSYAAFVRLRAAGVIAAGTRFQVSLPTPVAVLGSFVVPEDRSTFEPVYTAKLFAELDEILAAIPHADLAIQWDVAIEFALIENAGYRAPVTAWWSDGWWDDAWSGVIERSVELLSRVPSDVEAGFHLCYGDVGETHFVEPTDTTHLARFANAVTRIAPRRIDWIHLPVPIERDDAAYFAPLANLELDDATELYLGVVHRQDGAEGARRRIDAAASVVREFGISTECGIGRAPHESVIEILELHRELAGTW
jgi:hypothetical protein